MTPLSRSLRQEGYALAGWERGVTLFRPSSSTLIDLAAEGEVAAPPTRLQSALLAYDRHAGLIRGVAESRILRRTTTALWVHQRLDLPLLDDRDFTLYVTWGTGGATRWVRFACDNAHGPAPRRGVLRLWTHEGSWQLLPIAGGARSFARYQVRLDLGGSGRRHQNRTYHCLVRRHGNSPCSFE